MNWELLISEQAIASVLPGEYARFARPVREALIVFLGGLRPDRQRDIFADQMALPITASVSQRLARLAGQCPVLQKLGQVLARDARLSEEFRQHLQELESHPPTISRSVIERTLVSELGPLRQRGIVLGDAPIAEASVAVVIPYEETAGAGRPFQGVFKVLKPGIEDRLDEELQLLVHVGNYLDQRCDELQIPSLDYHELFQQVEERLSLEVLLDREQENLARAASIYAHWPEVQIPALGRHCTGRVTAMERVSGGKVTDSNAADADRVAEVVVKALMAGPVFSTAPEALFHGDPHAGNLFLTDDGRLALLDWSLTGQLSPCDRIAVVQMILSAMTLDARRLVRVLEGLARTSQIDSAALEGIGQRAVDKVRQGEIPGLSWLLDLLDEAVEKARLRVSSDLVLFRKALHTLQGVMTGLGATGVDRVLFSEFLGHFVREWPWRWVSLPHARHFATQLSNLDLAHAALSLPWTAVRFWSNAAGRETPLLSR